MDILYEIMDQTIIDATGTRCGRVDDIVIEEGFDRPPRVTALLVGGGVKAQLLWPPLHALLLVVYRIVGMEELLKPVEVPWEDVDHLDRDLFLKRSAHELRLNAASAVVAEHVIGRIPGARS